MGSRVFSCMKLTTVKKKLKPQIKSGSFGVFRAFWKQSENEIWLTLCHDLQFYGEAETEYHDSSEFIPLGVTAKPSGYTGFRASRNTFFPICVIELNTKNSTRRQQSRLLVEFLVFKSAFGRHRHWLIPITSYSFIIIVMSLSSIDPLESAGLLACWPACLHHFPVNR